jgi:LuxR family maltose regulon positive regulatory protein
MLSPIVITKLFIPQPRPELVHRPRLLAQLNKGLTRKLTLISAPAGFGKTTLVADWAHRSLLSDTRMAWISLDKDDNDPSLFLTYLIVAFKQVGGIDENLAERLLDMLQSPQSPPVKDVVTTIINAVAELSSRLIIVFDDYHLIEETFVNEALAFLIEHLPPQLHLVIVTRDDPYLPLARLRAKGEMNELRAADLRFTTVEIQEFLQQKLGVDLSGDDIAALEMHTEGWITSLQLVAISIKGHDDAISIIQGFSGGHRYVLEYLLEEVLHQQPQYIQNFLLQTAVLDRFTGSLCEAVCLSSAETAGNSTRVKKGQQILEELEHANLFLVPLDNERRWYRYHHLFSDFLRQWLRQTNLEQEANSHLRASIWYEENGFADEAIDHAIKAKEFERAVTLMSAQTESKLEFRRDNKMGNWLKEIPADLLRTNPKLSILNAWYLFVGGHLDKAELNLKMAEGMLDDIEPSDKGKLSGRSAGIRAFIASHSGDISGITKYANQALEHLTGEDLTWSIMVAVVLGDAYSMAGDMNAAYTARLSAYEMSKAEGNIYLVLLTSMKLAVTFRMRGELQKTIDICEEHYLIADQKGLSHMAVVGWLLAIWGEILAETNDIDVGLEKARLGVALTANGDDIAMVGWSQFCLLRVLFMDGNIDEAESVVRNLEELSQKSYMPWFVTGQFQAWKARLMLIQDKLAAAKQWVETQNLDISGSITQLNESQYLVFARILLAQDKAEKAHLLLQRLFEEAESSGRVSRLIEILILQALVFDKKKEQENALAVLEHAIELAEVGGYVRIFVDEGPRLARLLYEAANRKIAPTYTQRLLAAFPIPEDNEKVDRKSGQAPPEFVEQLSERELEVLQLIADGLSRREIATRLIISSETVKTHVRNLYSKLGVHNQLQAVRKAQGLGLLEKK